MKTLQIETVCKPRVVIIADDFTGALDTGVKLATHGALVSVAQYAMFDLHVEADVLVINAECRHLTRDEAYNRIRSLTEAVFSVPYVYIKTDSALRGQIGAYITAAMDALGVTVVPFAPAYPDMGRIMRDGRQYIDGKPLCDSCFAKDPLNPVNIDKTAELFTEEEVSVFVVPSGSIIPTICQREIVLFDAENNDDMFFAANNVYKAGMLRLTAGCAGFASVLAGKYGFNCKKNLLNKCITPLLVFCGSINSVTTDQIQFGSENGFKVVFLPSVESGSDKYWEKDLRNDLDNGQNLIITTASIQSNETNPISLGMQLQKIGGRLLLDVLSKPEAERYTTLVVGGDTLVGFMREAGFPHVVIQGEVLPGVVKFTMLLDGKERSFLSKSGGFGSKTLLVDLLKGKDER